MRSVIEIELIDIPSCAAFTAVSVSLREAVAAGNRRLHRN